MHSSTQGVSSRRTPRPLWLISMTVMIATAGSLLSMAGSSTSAAPAGAVVFQTESLIDAIATNRTSNGLFAGKWKGVRLISSTAFEEGIHEAY